MTPESNLASSKHHYSVDKSTERIQSDRSVSAKKLIQVRLPPIFLNPSPIPPTQILFDVAAAAIRSQEFMGF